MSHLLILRIEQSTVPLSSTIYKDWTFDEIIVDPINPPTMQNLKGKVQAGTFDQILVWCEGLESWLQEMEGKWLEIGIIVQLSTGIRYSPIQAVPAHLVEQLQAEINKGTLQTHPFGDSDLKYGDLPAWLSDELNHFLSQ